MTAEIMRDHGAKLSVETADQLTTRDIHELCDAADEANLSGGGLAGCRRHRVRSWRITGAACR